VLSLRGPRTSFALSFPECGRLLCWAMSLLVKPLRRMIWTTLKIEAEKSYETRYTTTFTLETGHLVRAGSGVVPLSFL
jgi:hypothetical protein